MSRKSPRPASSRVCIEPLEGRSLLSASPLHPAAATATPSTTTSLHVSKTSATLGQDVNASITVNARHGKLSGTVEFLDNGVPVSVNGQTLTLALRGGHASYSFGPGDIALFTGQHSLAAEYLGNGVLPASTSAATSVTITDPTYTTASNGLKVATVKKGSGALVKQGKTVRVLYTGFLASNGTIFDYAKGHGAGSTPYFQFTVESSPEQVIPGFDQGVVGMHVGEERTIFIPSALAYGSQGAGSSIPPNSDIIFLVKVLSVK